MFPYRVGEKVCASENDVCASIGLTTQNLRIICI